MIAAVLIRHAPDEGLRVPQELLVGGRVSATLLVNWPVFERTFGVTWRA